MHIRSPSRDRRLVPRVALACGPDARVLRCVRGCLLDAGAGMMGRCGDCKCGGITSCGHRSVRGRPWSWFGAGAAVVLILLSAVGQLESISSIAALGIPGSWVAVIATVLAAVMVGAVLWQQSQDNRRLLARGGKRQALESKQATKLADLEARLIKAEQERDEAHRILIRLGAQPTSSTSTESPVPQVTTRQRKRPGQVLPPMHAQVPPPEGDAVTEDAMTYFKCTRPDGKDFYSAGIDYGAALVSGEVS